MLTNAMDTYKTYSPLLLADDRIVVLPKGSYGRQVHVELRLRLGSERVVDVTHYRGAEQA